jgi:5-amino-6-(5-phospho-D-ribitylamino)uracil phosphatase
VRGAFEKAGLVDIRVSRLLTDLQTLDLTAPIKVVFFDIDGTLLDKHGSFSSELVQQIARIRRQGVKTAIASGRPVFAAQYLVDQLNLVDPGVFCTGAYVYDPARKKMLLPAPISQASTLSLIRRLRQADIYYELYTATQYYCETDFGAMIRTVHGQHLRCQPVMTNLEPLAISEPVFKFIVAVDESVSPNSLSALEQEFPELQFAYASLPGYATWRFANVIDKAACKRKAFEWLLNHYGVSADNVASFGDSHSDEVFLQLAGVGVAMGNASPAVQSVARFVTKRSCEDGVAYALKRLIA